MFRFRHLLFAATLAVTCAAPAGAADMMMASPAPVDCATAPKMMMSMTMPAMKPTGDMDHDSGMMMMAHAEMGMKMGHIEAMCGKDAKAKEAAMLEEDEWNSILMQLHQVYGMP